jgi:uncharacterized glyoxalase superfamily protein PhnB
MSRVDQLLISHLGPAAAWSQRVCDAKLTYSSNTMASLAFGELAVLLDVAESDSRVTLGFKTSDCDADFKTVTEKVAEVIESPTDRPWGVRAAYLRGPGGVTVELEQMLPRKS